MAKKSIFLFSLSVLLAACGGTVGPSGPSGPAGPTGSAGPTGAAGAAGAAGKDGAGLVANFQFSPASSSDNHQTPFYSLDNLTSLVTGAEVTLFADNSVFVEINGTSEVPAANSNDSVITTGYYPFSLSFFVANATTSQSVDLSAWLTSGVVVRVTVEASPTAATLAIAAADNAADIGSSSNSIPLTKM